MAKHLDIGWLQRSIWKLKADEGGGETLRAGGWVNKAASSCEGTDRRLHSHYS